MLHRIALVTLVLGIGVAVAGGPGTLAVRATSNGAPLAGAQIFVTCGTVSRTATADASGNASISGLPSGTCTVVVKATGFATTAASITVAEGKTATAGVALAANPTTPTKPAKPPAEAPQADVLKEERAPVGRANVHTGPSPTPPPPPSAVMPSPSPSRAYKTKSGSGYAPSQPQIATNGQQAVDRDEGPSTENYSRLDDNPFFRTSSAPLSTFSADVDTASYSNTRRFLRDGALPPKDAVRIEEMINYFKYTYPAPSGTADPFSVTTEVGPAPWAPAHQLVRIGLQAPLIADSQVPARNLTFLLDVSGSMSDANKLPLLKQAMNLLVDTMRPQDRIAIVVYAGDSGVALKSTSGKEKDLIRQAIFALDAGGGTNGAAGIELAYNIAEANRIEKGINRVILCTDGDFNIGTSSEGDLTRLIEKERDRKVALTVLGFGMGNLKDSTMEKLADRGNGNYAYIDSIAEARKVLVKEAGATLVTVAKDVKLQVEFNPQVVAGYRLIGYENRMLRNEDFNDDKKDAGDIGAGHSVTAIYEVVPVGQTVPGAKVDDLKYQKPATPAGASTAEMMTVKIRYKAPTGDVSKLLSRPVAVSATALAKTSIDFRWTAAVAGFGMMLRESPNKGSLTWAQVEALAKGAVGQDPEGYRKQAVEMIQVASKLKR